MLGVASTCMLSVGETCSYCIVTMIKRAVQSSILILRVSQDRVDRLDASDLF